MQETKPMKSMVLREFNREMVLEETEQPGPGRDEVVLRVEACGVCGTDLKIVRGLLPPSIVSLPHVLGHEIAGEVVEIGAGVKDVSVGQKGVVYFYMGCRDCEMCRTGKENLCLSIKRLGFELPGGYAEFVKIPAYNFCPFDPGLPPDKMAVLPDAVATSYHALKTMGQVRIGHDVLIVGVGGLGIHAVQIAGLMGARTIAVARRSGPLELARELGADFTIDVSERPPLEAVLDITDGKGVDAVIENVGTRQTLEWSLQCLKRRGRLVLVGYEPSKSAPLPTMDMHYNEWTVCGSRVSTKDELLEVVDLVQRGKIRPIISRQFDWKEANEALSALADSKTVGRTILRYDG